MSRRATTSGKPRWVAASITTIAVFALVVPIAPAYADDPPPLDWSTVATTAPLDGAVVSVETALSENDPFEGRDTLDPTPVQRVKVVNSSAEPRRFGIGIDIAVEGQIEHLWTPDAWGRLYDPTLSDFFGFTVPPGETKYFLDGGGALPAYPGRTGVVYEITEVDSGEGPEEVATEVLRHKTPGGFVSIRLDEETDSWLPPIGVELKVVTTAEQPELFPGVTATVEAAGLPASLPVELWLAPNFDYLWFHVLGANLPANARLLGTTTTTADGSLQANFTLPSDLAIGDDKTYQLIAGVRSQHYWPAGTYDGFDVKFADTTGSDDATAEETAASIDLTPLTTGDPPEVTFAFPAGTGGTWTATQSLTGPVPNEFLLYGSGPAQVFYHLDTTATLTTPVEVCITYASSPGGQLPQLYHYALTPAPGHWEDITTRRGPGFVCGATTSFSPFALGVPLDDGSLTKPAKGVLESDNGWDDGLKDGTYNINMNLWSGENARYVRLFENGVLVGQQTLTRNSPNAQKAVFPISGHVNGSYVYTAELENSRGVTVTKPITVKVTEANPAKPELSATSPKNGAFTVTANLWWGTNATSYRFLENGAVVATGSLTAATPNPQSAVLARTGKAKGTYNYVVEFTNAAGTTTSATLQVKVK